MGTQEGILLRVRGKSEVLNIHSRKNKSSNQEGPAEKVPQKFVIQNQCRRG